MLRAAESNIPLGTIESLGFFDPSISILTITTNERTFPQRNLVLKNSAFPVLLSGKIMKFIKHFI
jgi:hypothetical protein